MQYGVKYLIIDGRFLFIRFCLDNVAYNMLPISRL